MIKTLFLAALCLFVAAHQSHASVRDHAGVSALTGKTEAPATADVAMDAETSKLAHQLDAMLTARFDEAGRIASVSNRRMALEALSAFAAVTVEGLIDAAPSANARASIEENLTAILAWHQDEIAAALAALPRAARDSN